MSLKRTFWNTPPLRGDRVEAVPAGEACRQSGGGAPETLVEPGCDHGAVGPLFHLLQHRGDQR